MIRIEAPRESIRGDVVLPGSKSISNRLLVLNHLIPSPLNLQHLSASEDTLLLQSALKKIKSGNTAHIDVNHAGTDLRFLTALLAVTPGQWTITGSDRLKQRPIVSLLDSLRALGADIHCFEKKDHLPLKINGKNIPGGHVSVDTSLSSQFASALLLIAPALQNGIELFLRGEVASRPYIDMTISLLKLFNVDVSTTGNSIIAKKSKDLPLKKTIQIEGDWSAASYWFSVCALAPDSEITLKPLFRLSDQADSVLPLLYQQLGVGSEWKNDELVLKNVNTKVNVFTYDFSRCPDIGQTVAVTCFALGIEARLTGLKTLRLKETDRITALENELTKFGAKIERGADYISISAGAKDAMVSAPLVETYNDHRMAMSFAPLALKYKTVQINDPDVVVKSYPSFWSDLQSLGFNVILSA